MQVLIILFANAEINSRVASTSPAYYWIFAAATTFDEKTSGFTKFLGYFMTAHSLIYLCINMSLMSMGQAFV